MRRKRILLAAVSTAAVALLAWLTLVRAPAEGALFWDASTGQLTVLAGGWNVHPRWSGERLPESSVETTLDTYARDGQRIDVALLWRPSPGSYQLTAAETVPEGLRERSGEVLRLLVRTTPFACWVPEVESEEECPGDLPRQLQQAVASALGVSESLEVRALPAAAAVRGLILDGIAGGLPATGRKVLLLGLDGLDWNLVGPWARDGRMPNLAKLRNAGTWGWMESLVPTLSPLIWTTIATGVSPDRHGILDFVEKEPSRGLLVPVSGRNRRVPALWNLASALGRDVGVVGWWGSWPAEEVRGTVVSDRLYYTLTQGFEKAVLRSDPPQLVFPDQRLEEFTDLRERAVRESNYEALRYFMAVSEERYNNAVAGDRGMEDPVDGFRRILAATRTYLGSGLLLAEQQPDLAMVYLEGTDTVGHLLAGYMPPPRIDVEPAEAAVFAAAVPRYFEIVDRWIGRYLEAFPLAEYTWVVVSDHGFKWSDDRPRGLSGVAGPTAPMWHTTDAVFLLAGPGVERRGEIVEKASIYDVAPTVQSLLGLPADSGWPGKPLPGAPPAAAEPIDYLPLVPPESYRQGGDAGTAVDPEFVARLKSLGYLGADAQAAPIAAAEPPPSAPPPPVTAPSPAEPTAAVSTPPPASGGSVIDEDAVTRGQLNNLALLKINAKDYEEAERLLRQAMVLSPEYPAPHYNLRRIYMETGRYDEADRELWIAIDKGLRDPERTLDKASADYDGLDLQPRAVDLLRKAIERYPRHEPFRVHLLVNLVRLNRCDEGVKVGVEAAQKFPGSAPVHAFYGLAAGCAGDTATARVHLERSLAINPNQESLRRALEGLPP